MAVVASQTIPYSFLLVHIVRNLVIRVVNVLGKVLVTIQIEIELVF